MNRHVAEALLLGVYVSCFVWTGATMLRELFPSGLGALFRGGRGKRLVRIAAPALTVILSLLSLLYSLRMCRTMRARSIASELIDLMILLMMSVSPWACYQLSRLVLKPLPGGAALWKGRTRGEIVLLVIIYFVFLVGMLVARRIIRF